MKVTRRPSRNGHITSTAKIRVAMLFPICTAVRMAIQGLDNAEHGFSHAAEAERNLLLRQIDPRFRAFKNGLDVCLIGICLFGVVAREAAKTIAEVCRSSVWETFARRAGGGHGCCLQVAVVTGDAGVTLSLLREVGAVAVEALAAGAPFARGEVAIEVPSAPLIVAGLADPDDGAGIVDASTIISSVCPEDGVLDSHVRITVDGT